MSPDSRSRAQQRQNAEHGSTAAATSVAGGPSISFTGRCTWWLRRVSPFALAYALSQFVRSANALIAPELTVEFALSASQLGLITAAYFIAFAVTQLPLGILLDRFGSRIVESLFLLVLGAGCLLFALSWSVASLGWARALIGVGASVCLMAAFKAIVEQFRSEDRAPMNSLILAVGGLGAIAATTPLNAILPLIGWRGVFVVIASVVLVTAAVLFLVVPRHLETRRETMRFRDAWRGTAVVLRSGRFWCFAPHLMVASGGFMAIQSLWAVPWMMEVSHMGRSEAAAHLLALGIAVIAGHLSNASAAAWLARRALTPYRLLLWGGAATLVCQLLILFDVSPRMVSWSVYGFAFSALSLSYPLLTSEFPPEVAGRLNTALNLAVFTGGFIIQWGFGLIVDGVALTGQPDAVGLRVAYAIWVTLQGASFIWLIARYRKA